MTTMRPAPMTVGELSRRTGVSIKAIREYTDQGLIYTVGRSPAGYRLFDDEALWRIRWIRTLRGLGLTLAEIRDLAAVHLAQSGQSVGPRLAELLRASRARLQERITQLQQITDRVDAFTAEYRDELTGRPGAEVFAAGPLHLLDPPPGRRP